MRMNHRRRSLITNVPALSQQKRELLSISNSSIRYKSRTRKELVVILEKQLGTLAG